MSSSTQSSSDEYDLVEDIVPPEPCNCRGKPNATFREAWTKKNHGRRFFNCATFLVPNAPDCKYFRWVDPMLTNKHYRILLRKMKAICNGEEITRLTNELACVKEKLEQTEEKLFLCQQMHECDKEEAARKIEGLESQVVVLRKKMKRQLIYGTVVIVGAFGMG
ncbi:hypothetical protein LXL04_037432 [Taraxacum kok-saghyz]